MHEVERPDLAEPVRRREDSTHARRNATSGPPRQVQAKGVIHAVDPFVIPPVAIKAQPVIARPEPPPGIGRDHPLQGLDYRRVPPSGVHRRGIPRRPCQSDDAAGATD